MRRPISVRITPCTNSASCLPAGWAQVCPLFRDRAPARSAAPLTDELAIGGFGEPSCCWLSRASRKSESNVGMLIHPVRIVPSERLPISPEVSQARSPARRKARPTAAAAWRRRAPRRAWGSGSSAGSRSGTALSTPLWAMRIRRAGPCRGGGAHLESGRAIAFERGGARATAGACRHAAADARAPRNTYFDGAGARPNPARRNVGWGDAVVRGLKPIADETMGAPI